MNNDLEKIVEKYQFSRRSLSPILKGSDIEFYSNLKLPEDYIFYIENFFGIDQFIGVEFINLWNIEEIIELNQNYGIVEKLNKTIGIGSNGSGEFIGISIDDNRNVKIVLSPLIDLDNKYSIEIGTSLTDFLVRLDNGIDWF